MNNTQLTFWTVVESEPSGGLDEAVSPWNEAFLTKQAAIDAVTDALVELWGYDDEEDREFSLEEASALDFDRTISETRIVAYSEVFDRWFHISETKLG